MYVATRSLPLERAVAVLLLIHQKHLARRPANRGRQGQSELPHEEPEPLRDLVGVRAHAEVAAVGPGAQEDRVLRTVRRLQACQNLRACHGAQRASFSPVQTRIGGYSTSWTF